MKIKQAKLLVGSGAESSLILDWLQDYGANVYFIVCDVHFEDKGKVHEPYVHTEIKQILENHTIRGEFIGSIYDLDFKDKIDTILYSNGLDWTQLTAVRAIGTYHWYRAYEWLKRNNIKLSSAIHDTVFFEQSKTLEDIEDGVIIHPNVHIGSRVAVGHGTIINSCAVIEHDVSIGRNCFIGPNATILGATKIGDNTFVGAGAVILQHTTIGDNCFIQMGANVTQSMPANSRAITNKADIKLASEQQPICEDTN